MAYLTGSKIVVVEPVFRTIYLPGEIDILIEKTRERLGMNRSRFIQYCILKTLQDLNVVSDKVHEPKE